jgi:xanthine dehydrogenase YagT iron-sulfur-binding subunit
MTNPDPSHVTRRDAMAGAGAGIAALSVPTLVEAAVPQATQVPPPPAIAPGNAFHLTLTVNGERSVIALDDPRVTLLDLLRERLHLTGSKMGCNRGQCGACTVLANGRRINSCLALALSHEGDEITTIEGLAHDGTLHPVQAAFIAHDGFQCGFCTPGQVMSAVGLIHEGHAADGDPDRVREEMSGNICRCGAYRGITEAVLAAQKTMEAQR